MTDPLRFRLEVGCPVEHAFRVWTDRIDLWWPADHTVSGRSDTQVVLNPDWVVASSSGQWTVWSTTGAR